MMLHSPTTSTTHRRRVLAYHEFSQQVSSDVYEMTPDAFSRQLEVAKTAAQRTGTHLEVTFDDAHRSQLTLAVPILEKHGILGHFFAPAAWIGARKETASWRELRDLVAAKHRVGSHGNTHTLLTQCSPQDLLSELVDSRRCLEDKLGNAVDTISMPGGRWNTAVCAACIGAGYKELYVSEPVLGLHPIPSALSGSIALVGRLVVRRTMADQTVANYVAHHWATNAKLLAESAVKRLLKYSIGEARYQALWAAILRSPHQTT
jgi:peptidoglycan/xylan/chitin deacetylase (PgdA/CDA1 family)